MRRFLEQVKPDAIRRGFYAECALCGARRYPLALPLLSPRREGAAGRLVRYYNRCPECGRWVCDGCFDLTDGRGMCRECAGKMTEDK